MRGLLAISALAMAGCTGSGAEAEKPVVYQGIETRLLQDDLVNFKVALRGTENPEAASEYARCAAAQYTLIRGYGFLRHVRTTTALEEGVLTGDAVYTISPALPAGKRTIDAEVTVANCGTSGIPTV